MNCPNGCKDAKLIKHKDELGEMYYCSNVHCQGGSMGAGLFSPDEVKEAENEQATE